MPGPNVKKQLGDYRLPTGSSIGRAMECLGSVVLPHVRRKPGPSARRGTAIHSYIENARKLGKQQALAEVTDPQIRQLCGAIDLNHFPPYLESEVTYEYDALNSTARSIKIDSPRDYPYNLHCYYGTADLVGVSEDGKTAIVIDIKTGKRMPTHAGHNWQLRFLASAACAAYGCTSAQVALAYVNEYGDVEFEWADFDSLDISDFQEELEWLDKALLRASEAVASGFSIDLSVGDHCEWCPALTMCPAHMTALKSLHEDLSATIGMMDKLSDEDMGKLYDKYKANVEILEYINKTFRTMVQTGPVNLGDGNELRLVPTKRAVANKKRLSDFTKWLIGKEKLECLSPSLEDMSETDIAEAVSNGFIIDIQTNSMRKVRK